jgi:hypothetical protein
MVGRGCLCSGCRARWPRWTLFTHAICATVPLHSPTLKKRSVTATRHTPTRTRTHAHTHVDMHQCALDHGPARTPQCCSLEATVSLVHRDVGIIWA